MNFLFLANFQKLKTVSSMSTPVNSKTLTIKFSSIESRDKVLHAHQFSPSYDSSFIYNYFAPLKQFEII